MPKKIYRTVVKVEILSEHPIHLGTIRDIANGIIDGDWSGDWHETKSNEPLTGKKAANAMKKQGSDPEFFGLDDNGNDLDEVITCPVCKGKCQVRDPEDDGSGDGKMPCPHCEGEGKLTRRAHLGMQ